jgi:DNA-binding response OmpR family regulator
MASRASVLLVDDDARLGALAREYLGANDIDLTVISDPAASLSTLRNKRFDIVILDIMLPGLDGLELCRRIRATPELAAIPVMMLTAKGDVMDRVVGLELGADDYLAKPFNPRELLARVRALLRRASGGAASPAPACVSSGDLTVNLDTREVSLAGRRLVLTQYEFDLLALLARSAGRVLSRDQLLDALKRGGDVFDRTIDVYIARLRAKIEANPREPRYIKTVRGVGYAFMRHGAH